MYWIPTILLLFPMVGSGIYYFADTATVAAEFEKLGYPTYTLYFNAIAKLLGGIAIVTPVAKVYKEWAYAGYLFILLLALQALWLRMPENVSFVLGIVVIWILSYWQFKQR